MSQTIRNETEDNLGLKQHECIHVCIHVREHISYLHRILRKAELIRRLLMP